MPVIMRVASGIFENAFTTVEIREIFSTNFPESKNVGAISCFIGAGTRVAGTTPGRQIKFCFEIPG
jgi:hypothetical protein